MAVSQIEEKILGRLAKETGPSNPLLSSSLYQVLGLSILLSRKLVKARRLRRLDTSRDTKSLQLYHHIIWLAREGLSITEILIRPYCQEGEQGPECRVMAAKLQASFYHIFCLFHNQPPLSQVTSRSNDSAASPSSTLTPKPDNSQSRRSPGRSPTSESKRRKGKAPLRDPIPSMTSDASYITNPYAGPSQTPPPAGPPPPIPTDARRTPTRPPGLTPINVAASRQAASFLLPPINFVPIAREQFDTAQHLANSLLSPAHGLRLSISLEHAAFLWDCEKDHSRSRNHAKRAIQRVYASTEGLDDEEFADASALVQALGGILNRGRNEASRQSSREQVASPNQRVSRAPPVPHIDRTIAVSPPSRRNQTQSPGQMRSMMRTPERLSTVPEVESTETSGEGQEGLAQTTAQTSISPPVSRLSSRSRHRGTQSATSDKASKRRAAEQAGEQSRSRSRRGSPSNVSVGGGSQSRSRQPTPQEGISLSTPPTSVSQRNADGENEAELEVDLRPRRVDETRVRPAYIDETRRSSPRTEERRRSPRSEERRRSHRTEERRRSPPVETRSRSTEAGEDRTPRPHVANLQQSRADDKRQAIRMALDIITAVSKGLYVPEQKRTNGHQTWRVV